MSARAVLGGLVLVAGLVAGACRAPEPQAPPAPPAPVVDQAVTSSVLAHHMDTFGKGDVEGIVSDYAPDAVIHTPNGPVKGTEAIRQMFTTMAAEWTKPGTTFEMKQQSIDGAHAYIHWNAETADNRYEGAMDGFVVQDGKIVAQFFAGKITPKTAAK